VDVEGLTLEGAYAGVDARNRIEDDETVIEGNLSIDGVNDVTVDGFKFVNSTVETDSVTLNSTVDSVIKNSVFEDASGEGWTRAIRAEAQNVNNLSLENVHIKDGYFIAVAARGSVTVKDSIIEDVEEGGINADIDGVPPLLVVENTVISVDGSITDGHTYAVRFGQTGDGDAETDKDLTIKNSTLIVEMDEATTVYDFSAIILRGGAYGDLVVEDTDIYYDNAYAVISRTDTDLDASENVTWNGDDTPGEEDIEEEAGGEVIVD